VTPRAGKYITFRIARRDFAVLADCVRGIWPLQEGARFPVLDLRAKLGLPHASQARQPYIVAVEVEQQLVGFVVDRLGGVVKARERDFKAGKLCASGRPREVLDLKGLVA
jgi:chemotaxis signal transduction protein